MQDPNANHTPFQDEGSPHVLLKHKVWLHPILEAFRKQKNASNIDWPDLAQSYMTDLLKFANGFFESEHHVRTETGLSTSALQGILLSYLMHTKLKHESDAYQLLCITPLVGADVFKSHYRLLMRLFHPDRGLVSEAQAAHYAAKINWAYGQLKASFEPSLSSSQVNQQQFVPQTAIKQIRPTKKTPTKKPGRNHHGMIYWLVTAGVTPAKIWLAIIVCFFVSLLTLYVYHQ